VHIELPLDLLAAPGPRLGERAAIAAAPAPAPDLIAKAATLIAGARRPVILAGGGMVDQGGLVKALAEKIGAAVIPTVAAKGAVPDSHPLCVGSTLSLPRTQELLRSADVVIAAGTELAETDSWIGRLPITGKLIRIDIDPAPSPATTRPTSPSSPMGTAIAALLTALGGGSRSQIDRAELARIRDGILPALPPLQRKHARVLDALREALPADGIVASDMTQIAYTGCYYFRCERPRCWFHPLGYGTLAMHCRRPSAPSWRRRSGHGRARRRCRFPLYRPGARHGGRNSDSPSPSCSGTTMPSPRSPKAWSKKASPRSACAQRNPTSSSSARPSAATR